MSSSFLILLFLFLVAVGVVGIALLVSRGSRLPRFLMAGLLLPVLGFSVFGFLASFELSESGGHLSWMIGYAGIGGACLFGIGRLLWSRGPATGRSPS